MIRGICTVCGKIKTQFVKTQNGGDLVDSLNRVTKNIKLPWAKFPGEMHLPGMNFAGPGTRLDLRLNKDLSPKDFRMPVDRVDEAVYGPDLHHAASQDTKDRNIADAKMITRLNNI